MSEKDMEYVRGVVDSEGFDYAFMHYSDFKKVKDAKFHALRQAYVKAAAALTAYIGEEQ